MISREFVSRNAVSLPSHGLIDDAVLDAEDLSTSRLEDARHWLRVYDELLRFAISLQQFDQVENENLRRQAEMYSRRLSFWQTRCRELAAAGACDRH